jgi:uncharacterized protein (TIGR02246 family)
MRSFMLLTVLTLAACQATPKTERIESQSVGGRPAGEASAGAPTPLSPQDEAAIRAVDAEWARTASAGDGKALTALYSSDAVLLPPSDKLVKGEAVGRYNDAMTGDFSGPTELTTTAVEGRGDLAYAVGIYRATLTPRKAGAKPLPTEVGKYLEVLKKQSDGSWKIVYDMWSPDAPLKQ